ncbi:MAG TPA: GDP-mannose 4,6-dehydratase [Ruminococcus sp.]|nr:GDP-mannose 4,6-dehydratase [Ruminococcus sp.]
MKRALIIGGGGFAGGYLIRELTAAGYEVHATCLPEEEICGDCAVYSLDIGDVPAIEGLLAKVMPDVVFHLAAQSSVAVSWKKPALTAQVNVVGAVNVLEAVRLSQRPDTRLLLIGSGEEYGFIPKDACPLSEEEKLRPGNIYAATKVCQEMIGQIYSRSYGMDIVMTRSFNHTGPGQSPTFVVSEICRQIAAAEQPGAPAELLIGNTDAKRDFTDVRDVVRAYRLLAEKGVSGRVYNVGRGSAAAISQILETALSMSQVQIAVIRDPKRLRASDIPIIEPDVSLIFADTGWSAKISIEETVRDTLEWWREKLRRD